MLASRKRNGSYETLKYEHPNPDRSCHIHLAAFPTPVGWLRAEAQVGPLVSIPMCKGGHESSGRPRSVDSRGARDCGRDTKLTHERSRQGEPEGQLRSGDHERASAIAGDFANGLILEEM